MKILVVYDSVYGNTVQIARAIGGAIAGNAKVLHAGEAGTIELEGVDLLIIGAPTQGGRPTTAMQDFLKTVSEPVIRDMKIATFDTRVSAKWVGIFGYAAGRIAKALQKKGGVLEADPDNRLANAQLAISGERYREQKELEEKWTEATEAFERGSYRAALTIFYRMPDSEDRRKLDRYKLNGWYNMGLQALSTGDCNSASTHLKEAKAIDSSDKEVIIALDLARICKYSRGDSAYLEEVSQLIPRALED